ncbi:hypothetical protein BMETH_2135_0 [methanotrophic bacterial endosymbiont of Bathymodiolus sp.]|nr:hypothetical protein BMETH_2135_0 [methanotrophic bacterial endosymbiont of Bathymodiolus sp.]
MFVSHYMYLFNLNGIRNFKPLLWNYTVLTIGAWFSFMDF